MIYHNDDFDDGFDSFEQFEEKPMFAWGELANLTEEQLFERMNNAFAKQAHVVDTNGSDDQSERAELRCDLLMLEIRRRNLANSYWETVDN